ncbi:MAG: hypothetical protein IKS23_04930 [Alphaproteobacteria bacterium]|nr:hypothetical protein [Alphaproteobacteria bacterium]
MMDKVLVLIFACIISSNAFADYWGYYDENGNLIKDKYYEYTYDDQGHVTSRTHYVNGSAYSRDEYIYDAKGNKISETWYNAQSSISSGIPDAVFEYTYEYDSQGNISSQTKYSKTTDRMDSITYYDSNGNVLERISSAIDTSNGGRVYVYQSEEFTYDEHNNQISYDKYNHKGEKEWGWNREYTYDDKGNISFQTTCFDEDFCEYVESIHDDKGNLISYYLWDDEGTVEDVAYTYDDYGNLIAECWYGDTDNCTTWYWVDPNWKANKAHRDWLARRKLIYTVEEAEKLSKPTGNKFRIRYK